jgi:hypothetical protein
VTVGQDLRRAFFLHCTSIFQQFLDVFSLKSILLIYIGILVRIVAAEMTTIETQTRTILYFVGEPWPFTSLVWNHEPSPHHTVGSG